MMYGFPIGLARGDRVEEAAREELEEGEADLWGEMKMF